MVSLTKLNSLINELQNKTTILKDSLTELSDNIVKTRTKEIFNIPLFNKKITEVRVGENLIVDTLNYKFTLNGEAVFDFNNFELLLSYEDIKDNSVLLKSKTEDYIDNILNKKWLSINSAKSITCKYTSDVTEFAPDDIPNIKWFEDNFLTRTTNEVNNKLFVIRNYSELRDKSLLKFQDIIDRAAINILTNSVDAKVNNSVSLNGISFMDGFITGINKIDYPISIENVNTNKATSYNSVITNEYIKNNFIYKNLSNLKKITLKTDMNYDNSILTKQSILEQISNFNFISSSIKATKQFQIGYETNPSVKQTNMSEIISYFNEKNDYQDFLNNPNKYIGKLIETGVHSKNEIVTLSTIQALIVLIAQKKSNNSLLVTDSYYKNNIYEYRTELKDINDKYFNVPLVFDKSSEICTVNTLIGILNE